MFVVQCFIVYKYSQNHSWTSYLVPDSEVSPGNTVLSKNRCGCAFMNQVNTTCWGSWVTKSSVPKSLSGFRRGDIFPSCPSYLTLPPPTPPGNRASLESWGQTREDRKWNCGLQILRGLYQPRELHRSSCQDAASPVQRGIKLLQAIQWLTLVCLATSLFPSHYGNYPHPF